MMEDGFMSLQLKGLHIKWDMLMEVCSKMSYQSCKNNSLNGHQDIFKKMYRILSLTFLNLSEVQLVKLELP